MKKIYTVIALFVIIHLPLSCGFNCEDSCCGEAFEDQYTKIVAMDSEVGYYNEEYFFHAYNGSQEAILIMISEFDYVEKTAWHPKSFSFVNAALACSPPIPEPTQKLTEISIVGQDSVFAESKAFAPGDNLKDLFETVTFGYNGMSIDQLIRRQNDDPYAFGGIESSQTVFKLNQKPDSTINQSFSFTFAFDDSSRYEVQTDVFRVFVED